MTRLHSDHIILKLNIGNNTSQRGIGIWKFTNSLLHDKIYVEEIKKIIKICDKEYKYLEVQRLA